MDLKMSTHRGVKPATKEAVATIMPVKLHGIIKTCFGLDLQDPSEMQVLPMVECTTFRSGRFVYWKLRDVLQDGGRDFSTAQEMITQALVEIFRSTEVAKGEQFSIRGCIPHVGTFENVTEDKEPRVFKGTRILEA